MAKEWYERRFDWVADVKKKAPFKRHGEVYTYWNKRTKTWYTEGTARRMHGKYVFENVVRKLAELHSEEKMSYREAVSQYVQAKSEYQKKQEEFEAEHERKMKWMEKREWWTREFWSPPR